MSDALMSESDAGDCSASEEEWLPAKSKDKKAEPCGTSSGSGSDCEEELHEDRPKKRKTRRGIAATKRNILTATQRSKNRQSSVNRVAGKCDRYDSDSSGDEHLVDPTQLDFSSKFFDKVSTMQTQSTMGGHDVVPSFDCNAGMGQLSDSSEAESHDQAGDAIEQSQEKGGKELISKINEMSTAYVNFQNFTRTMEMAKSNLQSAAKQQQSEQLSGGSAQDVSNLLALGEAKHNATEQPIPRKKAPKGGRKSKKDAESDSDWEEVEENEQASSTRVPNTVQITLNPEATTRKKRRGAEVDMDACIKRMINRDKRDDQLVLHKMTIIMGIAHGNYANRVLNDPTLLTIGNGLIPSNRCYPKGRTNLQYLGQIMTFFREIVTLKDTRVFCRSWKRLTLPQTLRLQLLSQMANCKRDFVYLFIIVLRSIGIQCRLVLSLQVAPKLVPTSELLKVPAKSGGKKKKLLEDTTQDNTERDHDYGVPKNADASGVTCRRRKLSPVVIPQLDGADNAVKERKRQPRKNTKQQLGKQNDDNTSTRESGTSRSNTIAGLRNACPEVINSPRNKGKQPLKGTSQKTDTAEVSTKKETQLKSDKSNIVKVAPTFSGKASTSKLVRRDYGKASSTTSINSTNPSDIQTKCSLDEATQPCQPSPGSKIVKIERLSAKNKRALDRRVLSSDDELNREKAPADGTCKPINEWVEAFAEEEERWIPMDVLSGKLQCVENIVRQASSPMLYVLAWNNDGSIKDVSARYCGQYSTVTQKLRIMQPWMDDTLLQFRGERSARDIVEDRELNRILEERPLPKTIGEFKCHPYFALKRHLLKFEAIYPPDAPTCGFTSNKEAVYARECVHTLRARETWLKQARTVKLYETPYKIVSGRPKYDRSSGQMLPSQPLELFGLWQTEEYDPPTAEDGIVPRNAYGNVELFKICMLPKKTVHLRLPGLNRVCKKLRIDCAQAVTGFDFHGGSNHPVTDGFVVCEEFRDLVVDAWHQEQEAEQQRAREKYEKRVYGNWKRLIKGLLIRQRLQHKYNFNNLSQ